MSKLPKEYQFIDLSDYGRIPGRWIAQRLKNTKFTPIHVTSLFVIIGIIAIVLIHLKMYSLAAFFIILKSILDASDGELSRIKNTPSYTGRYYDSISDIILNFFLLFSFQRITNSSFPNMLLGFVGLQLQGTIYNYYYVILRTSVNGDTTSRIFENVSPKALKGEKQSTVNLLFKIYKLLYTPFDKFIYHLDKKAIYCKPFPSWFMSITSLYGLGFQLLIISVMLLINLQDLVIPFFIFYSVLIFVLIGIRRVMLK